MLRDKKLDTEGAALREKWVSRVLEIGSGSKPYALKVGEKPAKFFSPPGRHELLILDCRYFPVEPSDPHLSRVGFHLRRLPILLVGHFALHRHAAGALKTARECVLSGGEVFLGQTLTVGRNIIVGRLVSVFIV
jgi:hypothetical protein